MAPILTGLTGLGFLASWRVYLALKLVANPENAIFEAGGSDFKYADFCG